MQIRTYGVLSAILLAGVLSASGVKGLTGPFESAFYKERPLFSTAAKEDRDNQPIEHFGPVGIGINLRLPPFQMQLSRIDKGSPAEATGKLRVGQMIESINGQVLKDIDPRIQLGAIITQAEATDGIIRLMVKDTPDSKAEEVIVTIPVLGAYSETWPLDCPKSDKIVRNQAAFLVNTGANYAGPGINGLGLLYMLSTGEEQDLEVARGWVRQMVAKYRNADQINVYPWFVGYGGIGLAEYYLRTGDETVIPVMEKLADYLKRNMSKGGWNQRGGLAFGYGHMNAAGVHCATFLLLARECGAEVDEYTLQESLKQFYRFAGHGNVAYGDALPEDGFVDNGKTGALAFQMAAAAALTPGGADSVYARARDISAVKGFYSTSWMLHGHTGGGIGEIWRSAAMGLMAGKAPLKYREFMDNRQWFYELSRRFDGSTGIVGANFGNGGRYDAPNSWGIGLALTYTIPRKTLRITGAPPTKFSKPYPLPERPWGTAADEAFLSLASAADKDGNLKDWGSERLATDASWPILRRLNAPDVSEAVLLQYARHPDQGVRQMAARVIGRQARDDLILELLRDADPRVRQAGCMAIDTLTAAPARYEPERAELLTDEMVALLLGMIHDPDEAWWTVQSALHCLRNARTALLVPHVDRLAYWLEHDEWWLNSAALSAVRDLITHEQAYRKLLPPLGKLVRNNQNRNVMWSMQGIISRLREAEPDVQALALETLTQAYAEFPVDLTARGGLVLTSVENALIGNLAGNLANFPGGLEALLEVGSQRFPHQTLPHRDLFMKADIKKAGPALRDRVNSIIRDEFIPEHVGTHIVPLLAEAHPEPVVDNPGLYITANRHATPILEGLVELYRRMGVNDYDWRDFGPVWNEMEWDYFSFDPPEVLPWGGPGQTRYRKVTYPAGMENWYAKDFDAKKAGWKTGLQPFGAENGKLRTEQKGFVEQDVDRDPKRRGPCHLPHCRCTDPMQTLWEKEVLLIRKTIPVPPLKEGHRYRLVVGGLSHMNSGDGVRVYVNGRPVLERTREFKKREPGHPIVFFIDREHLAAFQSGSVTVAATGFMKVHRRSRNKTNVMAIWLQEMQMPPLDDEMIWRAAVMTSLLSADWQALQGLAAKQDEPAAASDPDEEVAPEEEPAEETDPHAGKFRWDGVFVENPALSGAWTAVGVVPTVAAFDPDKPVAGRPPFREITFRDGGQTDAATILWSGDTLLDLGRGVALRMMVKDDYLFIETGGFSSNHPADWQSPLMVMKRK